MNGMFHRPVRVDALLFKLVIILIPIYTTFHKILLQQSLLYLIPALVLFCSTVDEYSRIFLNVRAYVFAKEVGR